MMKQIVYFISVLLFSALYACSGQYDNIDKYASEESVYVGKFSDAPSIYVGYKRLEIELFGDSIGREFSDALYVGKAKKTVVEYEETAGVRKIVFDSVCSWVNITGLTVAKTYIFSIYAEDEYGHKSIPVEVLGKPYTDEDFSGIAFPTPNVIPAPTTVNFTWDDVSMGLSSALYKFVELIYSYVDKDNKIVSGRLSANDRGFSLANLNPGEGTLVTVNCRIIPIMNSQQILDTLPLIRDIVTSTVTPEEYIAERELRTIVSAMINPEDETQATITLGTVTDHLAWTEIRYKKQSTGNYELVRVDNNTITVACTDIARREPIQIRCAYNPPETDLIFEEEEWTDDAPFILKYDTRDWVVVPRTGSHGWGNDGKGSQNLWYGGHPMLILDDDNGSGWHSVVDPMSPLPNVLVIDMKTSRRVSKVFASGGYWKTVQFYLTDDPSIPGYDSYTVDWSDGNRESNYNNWVGAFVNKIPADVPESWGTPIAQRNSIESTYSLSFPDVPEGRYLILRFPDSTVWSQDWPGTYIAVSTVEVYSD